MAKYISKYRLANVSPKNFKQAAFHHCFSADIIDENDKTVTIKINSILDSADNDKFGEIYELSISEFSRIQGSLIKI